MALHVQSSFAAGELDPALHERTTLQKYDSGLATGRNVIIGKTGRVMSRMSRRFFVQTKLDGRKVVLYCPPQTGYVIEFGHLYGRVYAKDVVGNVYSYASGGVLLFEFTHDIVEADLPKVKFETSGIYVYIFCAAYQTKKLAVTLGGSLVPAGMIFAIPTAPTSNTVSIGGTGYDVDYAVTLVRGGQESPALVTNSGKFPIAVAESNTLQVTLGPTGGDTITEMRVYRRPRTAGAFGYIGSSSALTTSAGVVSATFRDIGVGADYLHAPPALEVGLVGRGTVTDPLLLMSQVGCIYQQRLLLTDAFNRESIYASRPGLQNNFTREYPLSADSQLNFRAGASGYARVFHLVNNDGLTAFTSAGVFLHSGALSPTNLSFEKKGNWICDENLAPIPVPGGILFVDASTNTVRVLAWSQEAASYSGEEVSVFSDHLFTGRKIVSWAFHEGSTPLLWVVFNDGKFASFTYERDQLMRAWTRHDTTPSWPVGPLADVTVEAVGGTGIADRTYFVVAKGDKRYIEVTTGRYYTGANTRSVPDYLLISDAQEKMKNTSVCMDSMVAYNGCINQTLSTISPITLVPVVANNWSGSLTLSSTGAYFPIGVAPVGAILRWFGKDYSSVDLTVTARASDMSITVTPSIPFPSSEAVTTSNTPAAMIVYTTTATMTGLDHLEGESVTIVRDGYVEASPNNDYDGYPVVTVVGGSITLPGGRRGAIVHVGRPVTADVETLDIDTVEQRPVLIESKIVNKLYVKVHKSRGLFVAQRFPASNKVAAMEDVDRIQINYDEFEYILGNTFQMPVTKRYEVTMQGDWRGQGKVCFRQVDPLPFEILSIIPDLEDERR